MRCSVYPGARDADQKHRADTLTTTAASLSVANATGSATRPSTDTGERRGSSEQLLSVLELQSGDENSKSAVTKLGLLSGTALTVQKRKRGRRWGTTWVQTLGVLTV